MTRIKADQQKLQEALDLLDSARRSIKQLRKKHTITSEVQNASRDSEEYVKWEKKSAPLLRESTDLLDEALTVGRTLTAEEDLQSFYESFAEANQYFIRSEASRLSGNGDVELEEEDELEENPEDDDDAELENPDDVGLGTFGKYTSPELHSMMSLDEEADVT